MPQLCCQQTNCWKLDNLGTPKLLLSSKHPVNNSVVYVIGLLAGVWHRCSAEFQLSLRQTRERMPFINWYSEDSPEMRFSEGDFLRKILRRKRVVRSSRTLRQATRELSAIAG